MEDLQDDLSTIYVDIKSNYNNGNITKFVIEYYKNIGAYFKELKESLYTYHEIAKEEVISIHYIDEEGDSIKIIDDKSLRYCFKYFEIKKMMVKLLVSGGTTSSSSNHPGFSSTATPVSISTYPQQQHQQQAARRFSMSSTQHQQQKREGPSQQVHQQHHHHQQQQQHHHHQQVIHHHEQELPKRDFSFVHNNNQSSRSLFSKGYNTLLNDDNLEQQLDLQSSIEIERKNAFKSRKPSLSKNIKAPIRKIVKSTRTNQGYIKY